MNYTYILKCSDGTFYCGYTNDLTARVATHNSGKGAKYTRGRTPVALVYSEILPTKSDALKREMEIKKMSKLKKLELIHNYKPDIPNTPNKTQID